MTPTDPWPIETKHLIILELARIIGESDLDSCIKAIVGSYGDTLSDREVLDMARAYHHPTYKNGAISDAH